MVFNPDTNTVIERADFSVNGLTTHVQGFIYETQEGVLVGVVSDSNPTQSLISRRAFMFNLRDQSWFTRDVTHSTSEYDSFMGVTTIVK